VVAVACVVLAEAAPPALVSPVVSLVVSPVEAVPPASVVVLPAPLVVAALVSAALVLVLLVLAEPVLVTATVWAVLELLLALVAAVFVAVLPSTLPIAVVEPVSFGAPESELLQPRAKASGSARVIARIERGLLEAISLNARADRIDQPSCRVFSNGAIYPVQLDSNWGTSPSSRG